MNKYQKWLDAKADEKAAVERRRQIEEELNQELGIPEDLDSSHTFEDGEYKIKVTGRVNKKVDAKQAQEIAAEHDLVDDLDKLFRWKAEINKKHWSAETAEIFAPAITSKPGSVSWAIERIDGVTTG